jgi:hypothetical protein
MRAGTLALVVVLTVAWCHAALAQDCSGGKCGKYSGDFPCQCDAGCFGFGDCCADICTTCIAEFPEECNCKPDCAGKACGSDGCWSDCGKCPEGQVCVKNACIVSDCPEAGDVKDCDGNCAPASYIADGVCDDGKQSEANFYCDAFGFDGDDCKPCEPNCQGKTCGWDGCGGECGPACPAGQICQDGNCAQCVPNCGNAACGDDGCGGSCGECKAGEKCELGVCTALSGSCSGVCGDKPEGGNCWCDEMCFGSGDCCTDVCQVCAESYPEECSGNACTPNCAGKACGDDGCGGSCGTCAAGQTCQAGVCTGGSTPCVPSCGTAKCGDDGCGGTCGTCAAGDVCQAGACIQQEDSTPVQPEGETGEGAEPATDDKKGSSSSCSASEETPVPPGFVLLLILATVLILRPRRDSRSL